MKTIKRLINKCSVLLSMLFCAAIVFSSCGSDDEDALGGVDPDKNVADPVGTITLSMRDTKNGNTYLDNIQIENENFTGRECYFASVGAVKGLGNVANIPTTGWASQVAVIPGNGYVAYNNSRFYRLYVTDYITATSGGIIGADVKYQKPFKGKDEAISLDVETLTIPAEGGTQTLVFKNQGLIVFDVASKRFQVEKASTNDFSFLADGIAITAVPNYSASAIEDSITLTTAYGKKTTLKVTQAGSKPFVNLWKKKLAVTAAQQTQMVELSSNIALSDLSANSSATWCKAELIDNSSYMQTQSKKVKFIGEQRVNASKASYNGSTSYALQLTLEQNTSANVREAKIVVKPKTGKSSDTLTVQQNGISASFGKDQVDFTAAAQNQSVYFRVSGLDIEQLKLTSSEDWCTADFESNQYIRVSCGNNPSEETREAKITLQSVNGDSLAQLRVVQQGVTFEVEKATEMFDRNANYRTVTINTTAKEWEAESSEEWCTFSTNGNQLTIRVTASTEDRKAVISFKGFKTTITVHQSKYAVGDNYKEDNIEGIVGYIGDKGRYIYQILSTAYWSTENVATGATNVDNGEYNMNIIKKIPNWEDSYPAFKLCDDLNTEGVSGWYLPAINELLLITPKNNAWSSTESSTESAYCYNSYYYNKKSTNLKQGKYYVYAVHKF